MPSPTTAHEPTWHERSADDTVRALNSDIDSGLAHAEVARRLARHGPNQLGRRKRRSLLLLLGHQFKSLIVWLLLVAGGLALLLGETVEAIAILVVIVINAVIGFATEWRARVALESLRDQTVVLARVLRDGEEHQIAATDLVPGDIVLLAAGDRVPADGRVVEHARLQVDESALTGESLPIEKTEAITPSEAPLGDRTSMVHMGTAVTDGRATIVVTATGAETQMGRIGTLIEGVDTHGTPLEAKLAELSRALVFIVLALCAVVILFGWLRGNELLYMVEVGVSLAIAAVPEGLLAVTTMTLAVGMQRMAKMNALVRRLPAVESLGSTTVICSDKTGTLTRNEMTVGTFVVGGRRFEVTGAGYAPQGEFLDGDSTLQPDLRDDDALALALRIGALCNDAKLDRSGESTTVLGDPTEAALIVAAEKADWDLGQLADDFPRTAELPFSSDSKLMVTVHDTPDGRPVAYVKGAPGALLDLSSSAVAVDGEEPMTDEARDRQLDMNSELAAEALRVLALAWRVLPPDHVEEDLTRELTFVGLVGMRDALRDEVEDTIKTCHAAGIRTVMITGDQEVTAAAVANQLGMDVDAQGNQLQTVHARDLVDLADDAWLDAVRDAGVFARVSPEHKLRIVDALQRLGHVVAMTGDGVNDAPALRKADIGIAMGIRGTEVAKESAAMVITDDNFATIVRAVEQGRIIVHNILRFIHYLFTCNFAEILTVFVAIMVGWPLPLGVLQILWLNLVTDIFPAMALALEPSAPDVMQHPPRDPEEPLMTASFGWLVVWQGVLLASCTLGAFALAMHWHGAEGEGLTHAITVAFMTLALAQTFHAFNVRSRTRTAFTVRAFQNRWLWGATLVCVLLQVAAVTVPLLQEVLDTVSLAAADWGLVVTASLVPIAVVEVVKLAGRRWR